MGQQLTRVNEYRKLATPIEFDGELYYFKAVGNGYGAGAGRRVVIPNLCKIYWLGYGLNQAGDDSHNIFVVSETTGAKFITDWAGVSLIDDYNMFVRVQEYRKITTNGVTELVDYNHGVRVFPNQVTDVYWEGLSNYGDDVFKVRLTDGSSFLTDWGGQSDIDNWSEFPLYNPL